MFDCLHDRRINHQERLVLTPKLINLTFWDADIFFDLTLTEKEKVNENFKKINPAIQVIPFPGIENAYIVISARWRKTIGDTRQENVQKNMSFFYDCKNGVGVEWEPNYGPIAIIESCGNDHEDAKPHFFYEFYTSQGNWMQTLVDELQLPRLFINGRYDELFNALRSCVV